MQGEEPPVRGSTAGAWLHAQGSSHLPRPSPSELCRLCILKEERIFTTSWDGKESSLVAQMVKNPLASAGDWSSIPGLERAPGGGNGSPLQCSCLEIPVDRGACGAAVHGVSKELDMTERLNGSKETGFLWPL